MPPKAADRTRRKALAASDPLSKLRQLGSRVLQDGNSASFTQQELSAAEDELVQWIKKADSGGGNTPGVWAAVDVEGLPSLYALYALALRRSCAALEPGVSDTMRTAFASLRAKLGLELDRISADEGTHITLDRIRQLGAIALRSQTLQCHAALLAEAAALLAPPAGPQDPQASRPQQPPRRPRRVMQAASDALTEACQVLDMISEVISRSLTAEATEGRTGVAPVRQVAKDLVFHLAASGLLEHWSRLLLLLTACEGWEDKAAEHLRAFACALWSVDQELSRYTTSADWQRSMRDILLTSPCLSYLLSSHVVGLCAALDGGPTYGMPAAGAAAEEKEPGGEGAAGVAAAPLLTVSGRRLRRRGAAEAAGANLAMWVLSAWSTAITGARKELQDATAKPDGALASAAAGGQGQSRLLSQPQSQAGSACLPKTMSLKALYRQARSAAQQLGPNAALGVSATLSKACDSAAAVPPLHTAAVFDLCMRLVEAAVTATAAQGAAATRGHGGAVLRVAEAEAPKLAYWALTCGRDALGAGVRTAAALGPATTARLRRWWAALVAVMDVEERHVSAEGSEWRNLLLDTFLVAPPAVVGCEGNPDRPSPCVAATLDAGYLPRFARALRRIPTRHRCWGITTGELPDSAHYAWEQVLAFAPPRETCALLRSVAALVQRAANAVPPGEDAADIDNVLLAHNLRKALHTAMEVSQRALFGFMMPVGSAAAAGAAAPSAGARTAEGAGGKAGEGCEGNGRRVAAPAPATMPRLGLALSCAASQLLPHVSQALLCRHLVFTARCELALTASLVKPLLVQLLSWAVLVAAALKRARDQEAAAVETPAAEASDTQGAAQTEAVPSSPPGASAAGSAATELRELLASLHLPTLLGTVAGVIEAAVDRRGTEALVRPYSWALAGLLRFAPLEAAAALATVPTSPAACVGRVIAESLAKQDDSRPISVARFHRAAAAAAALVAGVAAEAESLTELRAVELADLYIGTVPGLDELLDIAAFLVPPSKLESTLG